MSGVEIWHEVTTGDAARRGAIRAGSGNAAALGAADWLCLAAAPTFAIMALLTAVLGGGRRICSASAAQDASPLSGMVPMYVLMSAFHSAPWLKLISGRRKGAPPGSNSRRKQMSEAYTGGRACGAIRYEIS